jgi:electron transport complex protein RnfD
VTYIGTVFVLTWILGRGGLLTGNPMLEILAGGLFLGAIFMATDYSTSPITPLGQIIMGIGCGLLTSIIRIYGGYPEGVSYSILIMNLFVPLIDRYTTPKVFGEVK